MRREYLDMLAARLGLKQAERCERLAWHARRSVVGRLVLP